MPVKKFSKLLFESANLKKNKSLTENQQEMLWEACKVRGKEETHLPFSERLIDVKDLVQVCKE
jgi:hypothetical protein